MKPLKIITFLVYCLLSTVSTVFAQAVNKPPVIDAWISQLDPANLNTIRVNIQNSNDLDGTISKTEISTASGDVFTNTKDVYFNQAVTEQLFNFKGQVPITIKIWDNKNALSSKTVFVDANKEIKLQDNLLNKPFTQINSVSAKKYNFNVAAADTDKKYIVVFNRIKKTNAVQNILAQLLSFLRINTPINTFSGQININGIDVFKSADISQSTVQIKKFVAVKSINSVTTTYSNAQYNQVDVEIHEVRFIKETNPPIMAGLLTDNALTNKEPIQFRVQDESSILWKANINGIISQAISKNGSLNLVEGLNNFSVNARDIFGNISDINVVDVVLDTKPAKILTKTLSSGDIVYTNQLPYLNQVIVKFDKRIKALAIDLGQGEISSDNLSGTFQVSAASAGQNSFVIVTTDFAGNQTTETVLYNVVFNNTPPVIVLENPAYTLQKSPFTLLDFKIFSSIPTVMAIKINNEEFGILDASQKEFKDFISFNGQGENIVEISCIDAAGNVAIVKSIVINFDLAPPTLKSSSPIQNLNIRTNSLPYTLPVRFEFNETVSNVMIDSGSDILIGSNVFQGQVVINSRGLFPIHFFATDLAGNVSEFTKYVFVDFSDKAPVLTFNPSINNILTNQPQINISGISDQLLSTITVNGNLMTIGFDGKSFTGVFNAIQDGVYQIEIVATDIFGNITTTIQRVRVLADLPQQLLNYAPTLVKTPTGYRIDYGPLFNGPDKGSICGALDQMFDAIPVAKDALNQIDSVRADLTRYKEYIPDSVTRKIPETEGVRKFIGNVEEPLNRIKGAYLSVCHDVDILPPLDCAGGRTLFSMITGKFPEEYIIRQMVFIPIPVQDVLIPRTNICTGFDDSGLTCDEMIKLTPLIGQIFSPAVSEIMSSPIAQGVMNILLCEDLCAAPAVKDTPILCKDFQVANFPRIKKMPTRFNLGGPSGGISMDWGGNSGCGGFFNSCGGSGGSGGSSCGWFESCGGVGSDGSINGHDFACSAFPSLWFCSANNPVASTPPTPATVVNVQPVPVCDPNIKLIDLITAYPMNSTMFVSRYLATCMPSAVPFLPDLKKPVITVTAPLQNESAAAATVRVTGYVDDTSSKVKIEGVVVVNTFIGMNGIYFDEIINVPADGLINIEAADATGNLAVPVEVRVVLPQSELPLFNNNLIDSVNGYGCAVIIGSAKCWEEGNYGRNPDGSQDTSTKYLNPVSGLEFGVTSIKISQSGSYCAIKDGDVYCWGSNAYGALGFYSNTIVNTPTKIILDELVKEIAVSYYSQCALLLSGKIYCWGWWNSTYYAPTLMSEIGSAAFTINSSSGSEHICAGLDNGKIMCWGNNDVGQLGNSSIPFQFSYHPPVEVENVLINEKFSISVGSVFGCYQTISKTICWGFTGKNALGSGISGQSILFNQEVIGLSSRSSVGSLSSGELHSCSFGLEGLECWGYNFQYQLGNQQNYVNGQYGARRVNFLDTINTTAVSAGRYYTCILKTDNKVYCWGSPYQDRTVRVFE